MIGYSLYLNAEWDLDLDDAGNIQTCSNDYAIAQNVANRIHLFTNDAYYDPERGLPHFQIEIKERPLISIFRSRIISEASQVDGVKSVSLSNLVRDDRELIGELKITTTNGDNVSVNF